MKKYFLLSCLSVFLLASTNAFAFDGERKGFILGIGGGGGSLSNKGTLSGGGFSASGTVTEFAILTDFKIGYAPSNTLEIYYISKTAWWSDSTVDATLLLGLSGVGVSKYLGTSGTGLFVSGGVGVTQLAAPFEQNVDSSTGFGFFGGAGYEFSKHWSVEAGILYSDMSEQAFGLTVDLSSFGVRGTINVLAF